MKPNDRKDIEYRQLYMVVKTLLQESPTIDDAEWKAQIRDRLAALGFNEPPADQIVRAMTQVEYAVRKTIGMRPGNRPVPMPPTPEVASVPEPLTPHEKFRTHRPVGWDLVVSLMRRLVKVSPALDLTSPPVAPRREILGITEDVALREFWSQIDDGADRLELLRAFAEVAIIRPDAWRPNDIRAEFETLRFGDDQCLACYSYNRVQHHHIIQIQHGGSNHPRNFAALCTDCHAGVHPWLEPGRKRTGIARGWSRIGEIDVAKAIKKDREIA